MKVRPKRFLPMRPFHFSKVSIRFVLDCENISLAFRGGMRTLLIALALFGFGHLPLACAQTSEESLKLFLRELKSELLKSNIRSLEGLQSVEPTFEKEGFFLGSLVYQKNIEIKNLPVNQDGAIGTFSEISEPNEGGVIFEVYIFDRPAKFVWDKVYDVKTAHGTISISYRFSEKPFQKENSEKVRKIIEQKIESLNIKNN